MRIIIQRIKFITQRHENWLFPLSTCNITDTVNINEYTDSVFLFYNVLHGLGRSTELFWIVLTVCLMNYLIVRIKKIELDQNTRKSFRLLFITAWMCVFVLFSNLIQSLRIVSLITSEVLAIFYGFMVVKVSKNFKNALLQRALERLIQYKSKKGMWQHNYFKRTFILILSCILCIHIGQIFVYTPQYTLAIIINQKCYFPFNLLPRFYPHELSNEFLEFFSKFSHYMKVLTTVFCYIGISIIAIPFALITTNIWRIRILKLVRSTQKIEYTPQYSTLKTPLLIN